MQLFEVMDTLLKQDITELFKVNVPNGLGLAWIISDVEDFLHINTAAQEFITTLIILSLLLYNVGKIVQLIRDLIYKRKVREIELDEQMEEAKDDEMD